MLNYLYIAARFNRKVTNFTYRQQMAMRNITLVFGLAMAVTVGFCMGYEYKKGGFATSAKSHIPGYTLIEAGKGRKFNGDTVSIHINYRLK